jgi:hypothetical protein
MFIRETPGISVKFTFTVPYAGQRELTAAGRSAAMWGEKTGCMRNAEPFALNAARLPPYRRAAELEKQSGMPDMTTAALTCLRPSHFLQPNIIDVAFRLCVVISAAVSDVQHG